MVCCAFVVCTTPCQIISFARYISKNVNFSDWLYQLSVVLMDANSCINALLKTSLNFCASREESLIVFASHPSHPHIPIH